MQLNNKESNLWLRLAGVVVCFLTFGSTIFGADAKKPRTLDFGFDWKFIKVDVLAAHRVDTDDSEWDLVQLPHDWSIEGSKNKNNPAGKEGGFWPTGIGWYRKHFQLAEEDQGKKIFIQFDGIYQNGEVWINGHSLGRRPYGYISFQHDLTPHVHFGKENVIAVRVDNSDQPNCRWYSGSGIYRQVWLTVTDKLHAAHWGACITTPEISHDRAVVRVRTLVKNETPQAKTCRLITTISNPKGQVTAKLASNATIPAQAEHLFDQQAELSNPVLWSMNSPSLYQARTQILDDQRASDETETSFGIRTIQFDKDQGFLLNGQQVKMKGVCIHHDAGCLGAAVPARALERRLEVLQSVGCNAIRTSHNPPAPELLDLCDRMGFVVIVEAFDKWGGIHGRWFPQWWRQNLGDMLRRDRNHPSIVLWSVGNELPNQGSPEFKQTLKRLVDFVHEHEPTRPVTCGLRPQKFKSHEANAAEVVEIAKLMDVVSCNYQEQWFEDYRQADPEIVIIASESYPFYRGKGETHKAFHPFNPWLDTVKHDYVVGTIYWTGIDYLGEAVAGWPFHGWNCSLIDTCGFVRPFANLHKSFWAEEAMVHIAVKDDGLNVPKPVKGHWGWPKMDSHWTLPFEQGKEVEVLTFTNCAAVELLVNGKSIGIKKLEEFPDKMITWRVPYQPGRIEARGIDQGRILCLHQLQTAGDAAKILLIADRKKIRADGRDLCHIEVQVTDTKGILIPTAAHKIHFTVQGPGKIIGVDNGDITSMEPYQANQRKVFHGRALVVVQSARKTGQFTLKAQSQGLQMAILTIHVR